MNERLLGIKRKDSCGCDVKDSKSTSGKSMAKLW